MTMLAILKGRNKNQTTTILPNAGSIKRLFVAVSLLCYAEFGVCQNQGLKDYYDFFNTPSLPTSGNNYWENESLPTKDVGWSSNAVRSWSYAYDALCVLLVKAIKLICICTFFLIICLLLCALIPLVLPAFIFSLSFTLFLIVIVGFIPVTILRPRPPGLTSTTTTTTPAPETDPPFTSIPARKT